MKYDYTTPWITRCPKCGHTCNSTQYVGTYFNYAGLYDIPCVICGSICVQVIKPANEVKRESTND